jgi:hypothetical protein
MPLLNFTNISELFKITPPQSAETRDCQMENVSNGYTNWSLGVIAFLILYEVAKGATKNGKKTGKDWQTVNDAYIILQTILVKPKT